MLVETVAPPRRPSLRRIIRKLGVVRLLATALIVLAAALLARESWHVWIVKDLERSAYNLRTFLTAPGVAQDDRIVEVVYTDDTLAALGKRSPLDRGLLARALRNLDRLGARGIAIDILIDQKQPEDAVLADAFRRMRTPTWLAYTTSAANPDQLVAWQQGYLDSFFAGIANPAFHKGSIRIEADRDNVLRSWPHQPPGLPPLFAPALAGVDARKAGYSGAIAFRLPREKDRPVFASLPIDLVANDAVAPALKDQIAGRYVLIGGDISDTDLWDTPITRVTGKPTIGLEIHATMLAQLLDHRLLSRPPRWTLWLAALLIVAAAVGTALADLGGWLMALAIVAQAAIIIGLPFLLQLAQVDTSRVPAAGWAIAWVIAYAAVGTAARAIGSEQRRDAQSAFGRDLPKDVAAEILRDPDRLSLTGEKREIVALFTDLEGFTKLSHAISPEMVAYLLNKHLDAMCAVVLAHGGTIDKFVGDAVVAFWGAPIGRPDDADRAIAAAGAMYEAGERFREEAPDDVPPIGVTRVGVHRGEAVVGNFGGEGRIQYTALGDAMNTAARLESANKHLRTTALVSGAVVAQASTGQLRPMGRIAVSGRSTPIEVYEPAPLMTAEERRTMAVLYARFDEGDADAIDELDAFVSARGDDVALGCLVARLRKAGPGGTYVLDSK
jgi:adenylate cyclase